MKADRRARDEGDRSTSLPIHKFVSYRMSRLVAKIDRQSADLLQEHTGLSTTEWRILATVAAMRRARAGKLADLSGIDRGSLSRKIKSLKERGLLFVARSNSEPRIQDISLTAEGQQLYENTLPILQARQRRLRRALNQADVAELMRLLDKIDHAVSDEGYFIQA